MRAHAMPVIDTIRGQIEMHITAFGLIRGWCVHDGLQTLSSLDVMVSISIVVVKQSIHFLYFAVARGTRVFVGLFFVVLCS